MSLPPQVLLATCGSWWLPHPAKAFENRRALAGLWLSDKNRTGVSKHLFSRCWPIHLAMKPFYHFAPQIWQEKAVYAFLPLWRHWVKSRPLPHCEVIQAIMGFATELFSKCPEGVLKVVDCPNSHPVSYYGFWQRECDLWCPGEKVPIPHKMFARMNRELQRADLVLCPSSFVRDTMVMNGIPEQKCLVKPFGVDNSLFRPREILPAKPRFICVGTICVRKGHQYLFRAFELVKKQLPEAELICVGAYKTDFRKERPRWEGSFTQIEHLSHEDLAKLLPTCTAFVLPSQEEGFARVLSEAMAAGLPIIASHESGATTLVNHGVEGLIVRPQDPKHIAEAMIQIAMSPARGIAMGKAAFAKGGAQNSWQDYGDQLLAAYSQIRASHGLK
jgi:glycosyltransferase involved in cell wall biosynthesis